MKLINRMKQLFDSHLTLSIKVTEALLAISKRISRLHCIYGVQWKPTSRLLTDELS